MNKKIKKIVAIICSIALVVANLTIYQANVRADEDYSTLNYTIKSCENGDDLYYCIVEQNITGWVNDAFYGDAGNTFQPIFAGEPTNVTSDTKVNINGVDTQLGTGAYTAAASGIVKINPKKLPDNAYSAIRITTTSGSALIVIKKGVPTSNGPVVPETTTKSDNPETTTSENGEEPGEPTEDYSHLQFREGANGATDLAFATLEDFVYYPLCDDAGRVNLQTKPGEGTEPIYPDFTDLKLNGKPIPEGWYTDKGASIIIPASRVGLVKDRYNVVEGKSAVGGTVFHIIIRYGTPPVDPNKPTTAAPTEKPTEPPTTGKSPVQTEKVATRNVEWLVLTPCEAVSVWKDVPPYKYNVTPGTNASIVRDPADRNHIQFQNSSGPIEKGASCNIGRTFKGLIPGYKYIISFELTPKVASGKIQIRGIDIPLVEGTTRISFTTTAYNMNGVGQADLTISALGLGADAVIDITNMQIEEAVGENPTTQAPTTKAPTTVAPTTKAPTTTKVPTTVAPTTKKPITVAPTTKAPEKVKAPGKAKVSKVYAKKLSSKKIKLTIKKVSKAKGYQVAVYKSMKTAKKDTKASKALVKKYTTKVKYTVNSNSIKNKKKLYVKVRAYVLKGKTKVYGKWSDVKTVKVK